MKEPTIKVTIDSHAIGYIPFLLLQFWLILGAIKLYSIAYGICKILIIPSKIDQDYVYGLIGILAFECLMLQIVFPKEGITLEKTSQNQIIAHITQYKKDTYSFEIDQISYWWNYYLPLSRIATPEERKAHQKVYAGGAGSNRDGILYVQFTQPNGEKTILFEPLNRWEEPPNWPYQLKYVQENDHFIRCLNLSKVVGELKGKAFHPIPS